MGYKLAMFLGLTGLLVALMVDQADSACCRATKRCSGWWARRRCTSRCRDGTRPTPYCGYGRCNFFGCNCNGGCRSRKRTVADPDGGRSLLDLPEGENAMPGQGFDAGEGIERVAEEARDLLELLRGENDRAGREFGHHDTNQDMRLSKEEALEMLKKLEYVDISNLPDDWFESMDTNGSGYIEPEEYDEDLAKDLE